MIALAGRPDHRGALRHRDLDRGTSHAPGGTLDQHSAPLQGAERVQPAHRGHRSQSGGGGLLVAPGVGRPRPGREHGELGRRAGHSAQSEDPVADAHPPHTLTDLVDHARGVPPGNRRQIHREYLAHRSGAHLPVDGIDTGRRDTDADLTGPGMRIRRLLDDEHLHTAVLVITGCAHDVLPFHAA